MQRMNLLRMKCAIITKYWELEKPKALEEYKKLQYLVDATSVERKVLQEIRQDRKVELYFSK